MTSTYRVRLPDVVFENFSGDLVVLNLRTGNYFSFNSAGAGLFNGISQQIPASTLAHLFQARWNMNGTAEPLDLPASQQIVSSYINQLRELGLIEETGLNQEAGGGVISPMLWESSEAALEIPLVTTHSNLQDLLLLDPVHETLPSTESAR